jgi:hypothetical protein
MPIVNEKGHIILKSTGAHDLDVTAEFFPRTGRDCEGDVALQTEAGVVTSTYGCPDDANRHAGAVMNAKNRLNLSPYYAVFQLGHCVLDGQLGHRGGTEIRED